MSEEKLNELESNIIKTEDEDGNIHSFELIDVVAMGDQEYGVLIYLDEEGEHDEDEEQEIVIMKLIKEDDGYVFESIDDDDEFNRVAMFIEEELNSDALDDEDAKASASSLCPIWPWRNR